MNTTRRTDVEHRTSKARRGILAVVAVAAAVSLVGPPDVEAGTNLGGGVVSGAVTIAGTGIPLGSEPCETTSFTFDTPTSTATGVVFNTVITGHAGGIKLSGSGGSGCENALTSTLTTMTLTADGTGPTGSRVTCATLTGNFIRVLTAVEVNIVGNCKVNNFGTGVVRFLATVAFTPTQGDGVNTRITKGNFAGNFEIIPA